MNKINVLKQHEALRIGAMLKFSTLDYPGKISSVIFCQGCPNRCVYCHNPDFIDISRPGQISFDDVLDFLKSRTELLDAVVFSGGEPLIQTALVDAILQIKQLGYLVGIHTSGVLTDRFVNVLNYVDWVGFDIKTEFDKYHKITRLDNSGESAKESLLALLNSGVDFELRTTVDSRYIEDQDLINIAKFLRENGVKKWILQECILRDSGINLKVPLPSNETILKISQYVSVDLRKE